MRYRWCLVPRCRNNSQSTPEKIFIYVPTQPTMRKMWLEAARRDYNEISANSCVFICEDHFDIEKDMLNYKQYKMGSTKKMRIVDGVVPSRFHCLDVNNENIPFEEVPECCDIKNEDNLDISESEHFIDGNKENEREILEAKGKISEAFVDEYKIHINAEENIEEEVEANDSTSIRAPENELSLARSKFKKYQCAKFELKNEKDQDMIISDDIRIYDREMKRFKCVTCEYATNSRSHLEKHINSVHLRMKRYYCDTCDFAAYMKATLSRHIKKIHSLKKFRCGDCDYSTNRKGDILIHIDRVHLKLYRCQFCEHVASSQTQVRNHIKTLHLKPPRYKCDLCYFTAKRKADLSNHVAGTHLDLKSKCYFCDFVAYRESDLHRHMSSNHEGLGRFKCACCCYATNKVENLQRHFESDHLNLKNRCSFCDFTSEGKPELTRHVEMVHSEMKTIKREV